MTASTLTCASCQYSLQGLEPSGICPECSLPIATSLAQSLGYRPRATNLKYARRALAFLVVTNAAASLLCFGATAAIVFEQDFLFTLSALVGGLTMLAERRFWLALATSLGSAGPFRTFMILRLVLPIFYVIGLVLFAMSLQFSLALMVVMVFALGLGAIAAAIGSIAKLKFLNDTMRRWSSDIILPVLGWTAICLAGAAWLSVLAGTGVFIVPIMGLSYAMSAAWVLRARRHFPDHAKLRMLPPNRDPLRNRAFVPLPRASAKSPAGIDSAPIMLPHVSSCKEAPANRLRREPQDPRAKSQEPQSGGTSADRSWRGFDSIDW